MTNELAKLNAATKALAEAKTLDEITHIRDVAKAASTYAQAAKLGLAMQNDAIEVQLLAERKAGELLKEMPKNVGAKGIVISGTQREPLMDTTPTLSDLGITKKESSRWQKMAGIPEDDFRKRIETVKDKGERLTSSGIIGAVIPKSTGNEWWTPVEYIESVRSVLGEIDLDPASCEKANAVVQAAAFFTEGDNGLDHPWYGRVFMNPPYSMNKPFARKMIDEYTLGNVEEAIVLLGAHAIETQWFKDYWDHVLCFTGHRIRFNTPDGPAVAGNIAGSVFVYLGRNQLDFKKEFDKHGYVVKRWP